MLISKHYSQEQAANYFKVSSRTLIRWLAKEGVKWSDLKPIDDPPDTPVTQTDTSLSPRFPPADEPTLTGGGGTLPARVQQLLLLAPQLKDVPSWLGPLIIKALEEENAMIPNWERPAILNPRQNEIMDAILDYTHQVVAVEGDKRTGKSTGWFNAACEGGWSGRFSKIGFWASGEENAIGILNDVFSDPITTKETFPLFKGMGSRTQKVFWNNATIKAHSNNAASTSGLDFDLVIIDECHQVIVEHPDIFAMVAMTLRAKPNLKIVLVMNQGQGVYQLFKDKLEKKIPEDKYKFFTLLKEDTTHITEESDNMVRALVEASTGKQEADRWLNNEYSGAGTSFHPVSITAAYDAYDTFINYQQPIPAFIVESYDPSGSGHPMGWFIGACDAKGEAFWELESGELRLGDNMKDIDSGERLTPGQIEAFLLNKGRHHHITHFISESNMNGKDMKMRFLQAGFQAENQNFSTDSKQKKGASRGNMIHVSRKIMDDRAMYLCNRTELLPGLLIYDPDGHEKTAKFKGDCQDAMIQCFYKLARLSHSPYLRKSSAEIYETISQKNPYE